LFGIGALAVGATLLGAEKTEASPLVKIGLKAGKKLIPKFKTTQEAFLFGEKATVKEVAELRRLKGVLAKESATALKAKEFDKAMEGL
jgi:hypothetical protein